MAAASAARGQNKPVLLQIDRHGDMTFRSIKPRK
jgi:hypothetical protein